MLIASVRVEHPGSVASAVLARDRRGISDLFLEHDYVLAGMTLCPGAVVRLSWARTTPLTQENVAAAIRESKRTAFCIVITVIAEGARAQDYDFLD